MVMIAQNIKVTQIADKMCLSSKTVNSYRYRIFNKLNNIGDIKLTHLALRYGLIHIDSVVRMNGINTESRGLYPVWKKRL